MSTAHHDARVLTGTAGLDDVLRGGLPSGRMYLLQGGPGAGKTTLALRFLLAGAAAHEPVLYLTLAESRGELSAVAASHDWSLDGVEVRDVSELGPVATLTLDDWSRALRAELQRVQPRRVVIDSCAELRLLAADAHALRRSLFALKEQLLRGGVTVLLVENAPASGGDPQLQSLVHGVIELEQLLPLQGEARRRLRVLKMREVDFRPGYHELVIRRGGVEVLPRALVSAQGERDRFLAMLGHELRNPLSAITMALNLDRDGGNAKYRDIMRRQVAHMSRMVDDLLDVSRVTAGKIELRRERIDLAALVQRCLQGLSPLLASHRLDVHLGSACTMVEGDAVRLEQVVNNLLQNAAKYTPPSGRIAVSLLEEDEQVVLRVRDSGVGIGDDMIDHVFDLFAQAEHSLDRAKGGMGIGLTLVRTLVELHGGSVSADSAGLGQGTLFTVRLPRPHDDRHQVTPEQTGQIANRRHRLLLVEDNDDSRELLAMLLGEHGHQVRCAADGLEGVAQALASRPDVMLVDIGLPGLDGYGVAKRVREAYGDAVHMVALSGYGQPEDRKRALDSGFDEHLTKPVDIKVLVALLSRTSPRKLASTVG